jgi:hypothetical protein
MNDRLPTLRAPSAPRKPGFGATLLDALRESRRRQAAREIHNHRHLIDDAKARELRCAIARSHAIAAQPAQPAFRGPRMSVETKVVVAAIFVVFAILHVVGGTLISRSLGAPSESGARMHRSD